MQHIAEHTVAVLVAEYTAELCIVSEVGIAVEQVVGFVEHVEGHFADTIVENQRSRSPIETK